MKLTYFIQQKLKLALLLSVTMLMIIATNVISKNNLEDIDKSFNSMYNDRLVPVTDLFYISKNIYAKEILTEKFFANNHDIESKHWKESIAYCNSRIDSLITKYEKTYFVEQEVVCLKTLKSSLKQYAEMEKAIIAAVDAGFKDKGYKIYEKEGKGIIDVTESQLQQLTNLQSSVGNDLRKNSQMEFSSSDLLSNIQIVVVILIGIFTYGLILSSKVIDKRSEKFNLN